MVFDLETVPDLDALTRLYGLAPTETAQAEARLNGKFAKLPFHRIVCIGALVARLRGGAWSVETLDAPHCGAHDEATLIGDFARRVEALRPQLVTYNGNAFDLPVLRYRALVNRVQAPGLTGRPYFHRYADAALDLCDVLSNFQPGGKVGLDALCRALDLPGKPDGIDGSRVYEFLRAGRIAEIAAYCRADVAATYRLWLVLQHTSGNLDSKAYRQSQADLDRHLTEGIVPSTPIATAAA
jgi:predicted PolB exonuclease-like 3'-5' exonuclease